jgi:hypothetical protein
LRGFDGGSSYRAELAGEPLRRIGEVGWTGSNLLAQTTKEIGVQLGDLEGNTGSRRLAGSC